MNNPQLLGPSCLACNFTEQCSSCARRTKQAKSSAGRVGRLQFVVVESKKEHSNMHFGVKSKSAHLAIPETKLPVVSRSQDEDKSDAEDVLESAASVFRSDFARLGYQNEELIAVTDTSLIFRATTTWFQVQCPSNFCALNF